MAENNTASNDSYANRPEQMGHSEKPLIINGRYHGRLPKSIRAVKNNEERREYPRTILICLDGTGDRFDADNSNVVHFVSCLKKHNPNKQVTYYQAGIGTYNSGGMQNGIGAALDMAVGSGLGEALFSHSSIRLIVSTTR